MWSCKFNWPSSFASVADKSKRANARSLNSSPRRTRSRLYSSFSEPAPLPKCCSTMGWKCSTMHLHAKSGFARPSASS